MSSNGDTNVVLRGVTHGAVDFLIKPVRVEELRNLWQHVVRRRSLAQSRAAASAVIEEHSELGGGGGDEDGRSAPHGVKRKESEDTGAPSGGDGDNSGSNKKARVVWSVEMHQQVRVGVGVGWVVWRGQWRCTSRAPGNAPPCGTPSLALACLGCPQFVEAVNQLGVDKAVPKRILDIMKVGRGVGVCVGVSWDGGMRMAGSH